MTIQWLSINYGVGLKKFIKQQNCKRKRIQEIDGKLHEL